MKNILKKCFATTRSTIISIICIIAAVALVGSVTVYAAAKTTAIGSDAAANYAFADAGIDPTAAENLKTEFSLEAGQFVYEVEFTSDGSEYEYWIKASDGTVVKKSAEIVTIDGATVTATAAITLDKAKEIALADAELNADEVTFTEAKLDYDDGMSVYDVEFFTDNEEYVEYEYEINANTGEIYSRSSVVHVTADDSTGSNVETGTEDSDADAAAEGTGTDSDTVGSGTTGSAGSGTAGSTDSGSAIEITLAEAKAIALADAGVKESAVTYTKAKKDTDDGVSVYDIEFYTDTKEYEYEIRVSDGKILDKDIETIKTNTGGTSGSSGSTGSGSSTDSGTAASDTYITVDEAKTIALNKAGLSASDVTFEKAKLEKDDGIMVYEIEFSRGHTEYECTVNATTGAIVEYEVDEDD